MFDQFADEFVNEINHFTTMLHIPLELEEQILSDPENINSAFRIEELLLEAKN